MELLGDLDLQLERPVKMDSKIPEKKQGMFLGRQLELWSLVIFL